MPTTFAGIGASCSLPTYLSHPGNLESLTLFTREKCSGLIVADDLLGLWIPSDRAAQTRGNCAKVTGGQYLDMAEHVGDRQPAFANATIKILLVALEWLALEQPLQVVGAILALVPLFLDWLAGDAAHIDEDAALRALETNACIVPTGKLKDLIESAVTRHAG